MARIKAGADLKAGQTAAEGDDGQLYPLMHPQANPRRLFGYVTCDIAKGEVFWFDPDGAPATPKPEAEPEQPRTWREKPPLL